MKDSTPQPIFLKDYRQPDFWIPEVHLHFDLSEEKTRVTSKLFLQRNLEQSTSKQAPLVLNGEQLSLVSVKIDGRVLAENLYEISPTSLRINGVPDKFELETVVDIEPQKNLSFSGLYKTSGMFCTQCEAEGFRNITYFLDRPDVMSSFKVTIQGDKSKYPLLLSNGNPVSRRDLGNGRHEAVWHDPHKKPCYLFALVASDLGVLEDSFTTRSGRKVQLQIFSRHGTQDRCRHAMESLKWSMKWDEDVYGLEYDLDLFMIVAADDFNMGAMENKGLNIFNASYVLADPQTATDADFDAITAVVGHEYFHNWTGNRVTCRDWFQLSLKEGLTVFRDQRFSADVGAAEVLRIDDVIRLRTHQFAEDAGPMAHPIRPQSYISIDNFYTMTVYEKGSEVIRMIETILGRDGFRKGMDLYFKRHDGQAVTTEDFVAAMADANEVDLTQFKNWYDQAGTPTIKVSTEYNAAKETFAVNIQQHCGPSPGQPEKKPYHIPITVGLLGANGKELSLQLADGDRRSSGTDRTSMVLHLRKPHDTFIFEGVKEKPVLSLLRGFSAPVKADFERSDVELGFLIANDTDGFSRWEAAQTLVVRMVRDLVEDFSAKRTLRNPVSVVSAFAAVLKDKAIDPAFKAHLLALPAESYLWQFYDVVDVDAIHTAREHIHQAIAKENAAVIAEQYAALAKAGTEGQGHEMAGKRALRTRLLDYMIASGQPDAAEAAVKQRSTAKNMTDELGALSVLTRANSPLRAQEIAAYREKWKNEALVVNKWLSVQAASPLTKLEDIRRLSEDSLFDKTNPNKIYALYVAFARLNLVNFHDVSGEGYRFIADQVIDIDSRNPQVASRLVTAFQCLKQLEMKRQKLMHTELKRILAKPGLSSNVFELVSKTLS
ncbi:MAG TPA: aminopeptidase N [Bdellovibrionales bacterium]|nr:aminopeptidase N [Bdellovibrionales bacterium]